MMILKYDRERAREGCQSLPGAAGSLFLVKFPSAPVLLADGPLVGFLAGGSRAGRRDPCGGRFRTGVSPC